LILYKLTTAIDNRCHAVFPAKAGHSLFIFDILNGHFKVLNTAEKYINITANWPTGHSKIFQNVPCILAKYLKKYLNA